MGYQFTLRHANLVSYIINHQKESPRIETEDLKQFLFAFPDSLRFPSDIDQWRQRVSIISHSGIQDLGKAMPGGGIVDDSLVAQILRPLRAVFSFFDSIILGVYDRDNKHEFVEYLEHLARQSRESLFMIPSHGLTNSDLEVFDPSMEIMELAERQNEWPGVLVWLMQNSESPLNAHELQLNKYFFAPYRTLRDLYNSRILHDSFHAPLRLRDVSEKIQPKGVTTSNKQKGLLHVSDLHFGSKQALLNMPYLLAEIARIKDRFNRIVISGDLFDNPKQEHAEHFRSFFEQLRVLTGTKPIIIPGNHDQKWFGNVARSLSQLSELHWENVAIDDEMRCVFFCFDSSKDANLARGKVTKDQLMRVSTSFASECVHKKYLADYLPIAVIHHHPYSFRVKSETLVQRLLKKIRMDEEIFLRMDDADQFLGWCARRGVPLILHGHKHVQRHVVDRIAIDIDASIIHREVTAIGCGTSLGVEDYPLSYNIIEWDSNEQRWRAQFFSDPGDGSGFQAQLITAYRPKAINLDQFRK